MAKKEEKALEPEVKEEAPKELKKASLPLEEKVNVLARVLNRMLHMRGDLNEIAQLKAAFEADGVL